jgi:DNA-binding MarR family transcriptional regulator
MKSDERRLGETAEKMLQFFPVFYGKVMKVWHITSGAKQPQQYYLILGLVLKAGPLQMSELGRRLGISRPNTTFLVNRLIKEGKLKREYDKSDRRIIKVSITSVGKEFIRGYKKKVIENISGNLSDLSVEEVEDLGESLDKLKIILSKIASE